MNTTKIKNRIAEGTSPVAVLIETWEANLATVMAGDIPDPQQPCVLCKVYDCDICPANKPSCTTIPATFWEACEACNQELAIEECRYVLVRARELQCSS